MPKLKIETKMTHTITFDGWNTFIHEKFPDCLYVNIAYEDEMPNDTAYTCDVIAKINEAALEEVEDYLFKGKTKKYSSISAANILNYLAYKGEIPTGHYSIDICW